VGKYRVIDINKVRDYIPRREKRPRDIYTEKSLIVYADRIYSI